MPFDAHSHLGRPDGDAEFGRDAERARTIRFLLGVELVVLVLPEGWERGVVNGDIIVETNVAPVHELEAAEVEGGVLELEVDACS